jgi:ATP-dependent helicase/nuclease subunit B
MPFYTIPATVPFADALAAGLIDRYGSGPIGLSKVQILVPTRRACRTLREAFLRIGGGVPMLLPRMSPLGDVDEGELALTVPGWDAPTELQPVAGFQRQLMLTHLLLARQTGETPAQAAKLAADLAALLDELQTQGRDLSDLEGLAPDRYAEHWQQTLRFLDVLTLVWPLLLKRHGLSDRAIHRISLMRAQANYWNDKPPTHPIIIAGSTGSIPATAELMKIVGNLPMGAVVLPCFDTSMSRDDIEALEPTHPQFGMAALLDELHVSHSQIEHWPVSTRFAGQETPAHRIRVLQEALRPAATISSWAAGAPLPATALTGLSLVECDTSREEAGAIAVLIREAIETPGRTVALVTPDRQLGRRVTAELARWDILVDDSAGTPLANTPIGAFLRLTASMVSERLAPVPLLAALKHPLAAAGQQQDEYRRDVRRLERRVLRGPRPSAGWSGLAAAVHDRADGDQALLDLVSRLHSTNDALYQLIHARSASLSDLLRAHVLFAEALASSESNAGAERLWCGDDGEAAAQFIADLAEAAAWMAPISGTDYPALLDALLEGQVVRSSVGLHPRIAILGPLEARLQRPDLMILGSLNEGTWPSDVDVGPWLNRPMREALGLPSPERRIGQSALDFFQAACAPEVVFTRARKVGGAPTVRSRWLQRLVTFLGGDEAIPTRPEISAWHASLDAHSGAATPVLPPAPCPPIAARPRKLSVTQIEKWIRDPYEIYASSILGLRPLNPLDADPSAADYGVVIHKALETFLRDNPGPLPSDALDRLLSAGRQAFGNVLAEPGIWSFWWPRFTRVAEWFVAQEKLRRPTLTESHVECTGVMEIPSPAGRFVVTCKADRLDITIDGQLAIIDYKTGALPTWRAVSQGLSPQLPLEACIAIAGGFPMIEGRFSIVGELAFWRLRSGAPPAEVASYRKDIAELAKQTTEGLAALIAHFDKPDTPYPARPRPTLVKSVSDFDHLARVPEWMNSDISN